MALKPLNLEVGSPRGSNGTRTIDRCPGWYSKTSLLHCHQLDLRGRSPSQNPGTFSQAGLDMDFATLALRDDDGDGRPSCPTQQVLIAFVFHQAESSPCPFRDPRSFHVQKVYLYTGSGSNTDIASKPCAAWVIHAKYCAYVPVGLKASVARIVLVPCNVACQTRNWKSTRPRVAVYREVARSAPCRPCTHVRDDLHYVNKG